MKQVFTLLLSLGLFGIFNSYGQDFSNLNIETSAGTYLSTSGRTPLLNKTNQYGIIPKESNSLFLNVKMETPYDSALDNGKLKNWGFSYGLESQVNMGKKSQILFPVINAGVRFKGFELYAGRKKEVLGLADTSGTWGSVIWSGNAIPMPKVQISTPRFVPLAAHGFLSVNLGYSHGWFGKQTYTDNYFLHQKWLYVKLGSEKNIFNFLGGFNHQVQWGGYSEIFKDNDKATNKGYFAGDAFTYLNVVLPFGGVWKTPPGKNYVYWESGNRFGNHLGSIDLGFQLNFDKAKISFYRQTPWEDGQAPEVFLSGDGNYTFMIEPLSLKQIRKISFELLNTLRQGYELTRFAEWIGWKEKHPGELQSYFNHGQYLDGWSYNDFILGAPAIIPHNDLPEEFQVENYKQMSKDNMVLAPAVSVSGKYKQFTYKINLAYIQSKGLLKSQYAKPLNQFSSRFHLAFPLKPKNLHAKLDLGIDSGQLYGNNAGINLGFTKLW